MFLETVADRLPVAMPTNKGDEMRFTTTHHRTFGALAGLDVAGGGRQRRAPPR